MLDLECEAEQQYQNAPTDLASVKREAEQLTMPLYVRSFFSTPTGVNAVGATP